jgi:RNA polymerase sigma-B factor
LKALGTDALLARWREEGDRAAREELVVRFLPLARRLAGHYRASSEPLEDLVQVASMGLLGAIDRFDPAHGVRFSTFAVPTIIGEIKHYFRNAGWSAHVPPETQELALRVDVAAREITSRSGRRPEVAALAEQLDITTDDVLAGIMAGAAHYSISLATPSSVAYDDGEVGTLADSLGAEDDNYAAVESVLSVSAGLTELPDLQRRALTLRLGRSMKQTEIARRLDCSQNQVSRLLHRATAALHELIDPALGSPR